MLKCEIGLSSVSSKQEVDRIAHCGDTDIRNYQNERLVGRRSLVGRWLVVNILFNEELILL